MFCLHEDVLSVSTVQLGVVFDARALGAVLFSQKQVKSGENLRFINIQGGRSHINDQSFAQQLLSPVWQTYQARISPVPFVPATCACKRVFVAFTRPASTG